MSTQTEHLNLDLREAADIFNPLSTNANFETLDSVIYDIQTKGGVPTYTTTASANLLKLSDNPSPNSTVFKFVAAGDANTWSYQETVNNIISLDGTQKTVKAGEMYVAWVNSANAMVVIAWPDVVNAQTFDGKGPTEWATTAQLQAVNTTATNATTTAQAAATVANNALEVAQKAGMKVKTLWENSAPSQNFASQVVNIDFGDAKYILIEYIFNVNSDTTYCAIQPVGNGLIGYLIANSLDNTGLYTTSRKYTQTDTSIYFTTGYYRSTSTSSGNSHCIPTKIVSIS